MTPSTARHSSARRRRGELLGRTALCGALLTLALSAPSLATAAVAGLPVFAGTQQVNAGGGLATVRAPSSTELDVTLNAPRTVMDWSSYNVTAGRLVSYAFGARNWIVLNRIQGSTPPTISGTIEGRVNGAYGGNIWFASANGMIFSSGAKVDAGGILISAAAPNLSGTAGFLNPDNLNFTFSGSDFTGAPAITVQSGASINGHGGLVALISPTVVTASGASVTGQGGASVLYGATQGYQLTLQQGAPGDFDLVDFIIPSSGSGSSAAIGLDLQGATTANSVFVAMVSRATAASAVINLQGLVTAQAATADGGDIILSGGGGIVGRAAGPAVAGGTATDIYLRVASAARDIQLQTNGQVFGQPFVRPSPPVISPPANGAGNGGSTCACGVAPGGRGQPAETPSALLQGAVDSSQISNLTAGRDIKLVASNTIALGAAKAARNLTLDGRALQANSLTAGGALALTSESGDINVGALSLAGNGVIQSSGGVQIAGVALTSGGQKLTVRSTGDASIGDGTGSAAGGTLTLTAGGAANVNLTSATFDTLTAGGAANLQGGGFVVDTLTAGGSASVHTTSFTGKTLKAGAGADLQGGSFSVDTLNAGGAASVHTTSFTGKTLTAGGAADLQGGNFSVDNLTAGGAASVHTTSFTGKTLTASAAVDLQGGNFSVDNLTAGGAASVHTTSFTGKALAAGAGADLQGGSFTVDTLTAGGAASVHTTSFTGKTLTAGAGADLQGGSFSVDILTAGAGANVLTSSFTTKTLTAGGAATLQADSLSIGAVKAQQILAQGGTVTVASATSAGDVYVSASGAATVGTATAGDDIYVLAGSGTASLTNATLTGAGADTVGPAFAGNPDVAGNGRVVAVQSSGGDALLGLGAGSVAGATKVSVLAGQDANVDLPGGLPGALTISAARDATLRAPTVNFDTVTAGRDINLTATAGGFSSGRALTAARNITIGATGALQLADITATSGSITLTGASVTAAAVQAGQDLTLKALTGGVTLASFKVGEDLTVQGATLSLGQQLAPISRDLSITTPGDFASASNLSAGRNVTLAAGGAVQLADITASTGSIILTGASVKAGSVQAGQDLTLKALTGGVTLASFKVGEDLTVQGATLSLGQQLAPISRDLSIITSGDFTSASNLSAGRNVTLTAGGGVQLADVTASSGSIALTGASVNAGSVQAGQDLTLKATTGGVTVASFKAGEDLTLQGATLSLGQQLAPISRDLSITASGGFTTTSNLSAGRNVTLTASGGVQLADIAASSGSITLTGASVNAGSVQAGQDLTVKATTGGVTLASFKAGEDVTVQGATLSLGQQLAPISRDLSITTSGGFTSASSLSAGRNVTLTAGGAVQLADVTASSGSIALNGASLKAGSVQAGQDLTLKASSGGVTLASFKVGEDLTVQGSSLSLGQQLAPIGRDLSVTSPGDFSSASDLSAGRNVTVSAGGTANLQNVTASAGVVQLSANTLTAKTLTALQGVTLNIKGAASLVGVTASTIGIVAADLNASGALTAQQGVLLDVQGKANLGAVTGSNIRIVSTDLDFSGALTAPTVQIESRSGALRVGGSAADGAPASGLWLDNAEFGRIHASGQLNLYAGATDGTARGDLTVLAVDVNPQSTPQVNFLVGGGHNALVQGALAPTTSGGIVHIGDSANPAWQPNSILISGSVGAAAFSGGTYSNVRAFDDLRLFAAQDIIIGSQRFIDLIQATSVADIQIGKGKPAGVAPLASERNHVLIAAGQLELSATGKVVSQNTAPLPTQSVGLFLTGKTDPDLIIDPPQLVDLYGAFVSQAGAVVTSFSAGQGIPIAIVDSAGNPTIAPVGAVYRFNSCAVDTTQCSAAGTVTANLQQTTPAVATSSGAPIGSDLGSDATDASSGGGGDSSSGDSSSGGGGGKAGSRNVTDRNRPPALLSAGPGETDDLLTDPVTTGAGSEEIWRKRAREHVAAKPEAKP